MYRGSGNSTILSSCITSYCYSPPFLSPYTMWYSMCVIVRHFSPPTQCGIQYVCYSPPFLSPYTMWYSMCVTSCTFSSVWTAPVLMSLTWTPAHQTSFPAIWCFICLKLSSETPPTLVRVSTTVTRISCRRWLPSLVSKPHPAFRRFQDRKAVLQATESWVGPGNEASGCPK